MPTSRIGKNRKSSLHQDSARGAGLPPGGNPRSFGLASEASCLIRSMTDGTSRQAARRSSDAARCPRGATCESPRRFRRAISPSHSGARHAAEGESLETARIPRPSGSDSAPVFPDEARIGRPSSIREVSRMSGFSPKHRCDRFAFLRSKKASPLERADIACEIEIAQPHIIIEILEGVTFCRVPLHGSESPKGASALRNVSKRRWGFGRGLEFI